MDRRTKRQKLKAMRDQSVSPHEAEIAKQKLEELGPDPVPDSNVNISIQFVRRTTTIQYPGSNNPEDAGTPLEGGAWYYDFTQDKWKKM